MTEESSWQLSDAGGVRQAVSFFHQDASEEMPDGPFDVICSRYAVCLYMEQDRKTEVLTAMVQRLRPGGFLVIGRKERLPEGFCRSNGLSQVVCRAEDEFCPFGPQQLLEDIFRKDPTPTASGVEEERLEHEPTDPRFKASSYVEYLKSIGQVPQWTSERERVWTEMRAQRMTDKSRRLLEKAWMEGRRSEAEGSLISRMAKDFEGRQERQRAREAQKVHLDDAATLHTQQELSKEEASTKVRSFFGRLQQDIAQRETAAQEAQKSQQSSQRPRRRRSRHRSSTLPSGGKTRHPRSHAGQDAHSIPSSEPRMKLQQKSRTH